MMSEFERPRPIFPKRAIVTTGMPYGNKELHFGHIGGMIVQADCFARFLKCRIGKDNVILQSGTDCYGSPILEGYRKAIEAKTFDGSMVDYVKRNHNKQVNTFKNYEIGYDFLTINADRSVVDSDGIPLVLVPLKEELDEEENVLRNGFSTASHIHHARNSSFAKHQVSDHSLCQSKGYVVIDLETTGLHPERDKIIEIGAVKWDGIKETFYNALVNIHETIPPVISGLTGITDDMLKEGKDIKSALQEFCDFIGNNILVGYNLSFDMDFLNTALHKCGMQGIGNDIIDVLKTVKREKLFQENYKLQTTLKSYGISGTVPHRALEDAKLIFQLSNKLNVFYKFEN